MVYLMIFLLAGNYKEAMHWCAENEIQPRSRELHIITNPDKLCGYRFKEDVDEFVVYGTWSYRKDLNEIWDRMSTMGCPMS